MSGEVLVRLEGVTYSYRDAPVVDDVSLTIGTGELTALVGPNGSGKSTLLRLMVGLLRPQRGRALLFGDDPVHLRDRARLGYVPQRPALAQGLAATVENVVTAGRLARTGWRGRMRAADRQAVDHALAAVGLGDMRRQRVSELSGGQQQRTFIARALAGDPDLLVLDEPVAGVDAESQNRFRDSVVHLTREHGGSVLLVSHELGAVADALDRVIVLKQGVRFDGTPAALVSEGVHLGVHDRDLPLWLEGIH
jgi:zinc transport system ATP-binding protein